MEGLDLHSILKPEKFEVSNDGDTAQSEETYVIFPLPKEIMNTKQSRVFTTRSWDSKHQMWTLNDEGTAAQADGDEGISHRGDDRKDILFQLPILPNQ